MKTFAICCAFAISLFILGGCNSNSSSSSSSSPDHQSTPGEKAGHAAYEVQKDAKKVANEAAKEIKSFAHDAKEGFQNAKEKDAKEKGADKSK